MSKDEINVSGNDLDQLIKHTNIINKYKESLKDYMEENSELQYRVKELEEELDETKEKFWHLNDGNKKLDEQNRRYKQALEELRNYAMNLPVDREEDGSPVEDDLSRAVYEITTQALKGESE